MIQLQHLTRRYGELLAVDDVSFTINRGEVVGLLGHNGAGKTTIMKMLTGYLEPSSGTIEVDGLRIGVDTAAIQRRIGYLPENCPLWPEMSVCEFLAYQAALHDLPASARGPAVARAIRRTELGAKATQPIQTLSRGYRQRVGVAQAILHRPDIVILDEPTNGLDPTQILHMRALIRDLAQTATVIVSTHILQEVQAVCERVLIMRSGRKVIDARLDELQRDAQLLVTIDRAQETAGPVLSSVEGVRAILGVEALNDRYRYTLAAGPESAPAVARAVQQAGFALHEMVRERRTLEAVFAEVNTTAETGSAIAGAAAEVPHAA